MKYIEYKFTNLDEQQTEILIAELAEVDFESFSDFDPVEKSFSGYVQDDNEQRQEIENVISNFSYERTEIEQQNWNSLWECSFEPIKVGGRCYIRATFHEPLEIEHEIVITPKMSFGTGHHPTTHLVVELMLEEDFEGKSGLDMGSGTGILAILAAQKGACGIDAIDIDEWAYENCIENAQLNNVQSIVNPIMGDASAVADNYEFVLANINRNILLRDMPIYVKSMKDGAFIIVSGILEMDIPAIKAKAEELGLKPEQQMLRDGWAAIKFVKVS